MTPDVLSWVVEWATVEGGPMQREVRVSDADRERVLRRLNHALGEGRLTVAEVDERIAAAFAARTRGELDGVLHDLPPDLW